MSAQIGPGTMNSVEMTATVVVHVVVGDATVTMEWAAVQEATE